jgi:hypothetical protein
MGGSHDCSNASGQAGLDLHGAFINSLAICQAIGLRICLAYLGISLLERGDSYKGTSPCYLDLATQTLECLGPLTHAVSNASEERPVVLVANTMPADKQD